MKKLISSILLVCMMALMLAGCSTATATTTDGTTGSAAGSFAMIAVMFIVFYFFLIMPEKKRKKKAEEMRNSIEVGDKITTIGGMVGCVVHVSGDKLTFETGEDRVRIEILKSAVSINDGKGKKEKVDSEETLEG